MTPDDEDTVVAALRNYAIRAPQDSDLADEAEREYVARSRDHAALLKWAERAQGFIKQTHAALDGEDLHMMFDLMSDSAALLAEFDVLRERP